MWSILAIHPTTVSHSGCFSIVMKPHRSHRHHRHTLSLITFFGKIFRPISTQIGASLSNLPYDGNLVGKHLSTCQIVSIYSHVPKFTRRHKALFGHGSPSTMLPVVDKPLPPLVVSHHHWKTPNFPLFLSNDCLRAILLPESPFLCFFNLYDNFKALGVVCSFWKY